MHKIYLDNASTSFPKPPSVAKEVYNFLAHNAVNINRGSYNNAYSVEEIVFETRELLKASLQNSITIAKINAKQKFTPKKYRK